MAKIIDIIQHIEEFAPISLQADFDNCGLKLGDVNRDVTGILVTLDTNEAVVKEAIAINANLIIEHHPSIFRAIKRLDFSLPLHKTMALAIKNDIAIYTAHTNVDFAEGGLNDYVAMKMGLTDTRYIDDPSGPRIGILSRETTLQEYAVVLSDLFCDTHIRTIGEPNRPIRRVSVVNGGGGGSEEDLLLSIREKADVFVTGDVKYNVARLAKDANYAIIEFGHYDSEQAFMPLLREKLQSAFPSVPIRETTALENPYN